MFYLSRHNTLNKNNNSSNSFTNNSNRPDRLQPALNISIVAHHLNISLSQCKILQQVDKDI